MKTISIIDGKKIKSEEELLKKLCGKLIYFNYVELDNISSVDVLQECVDEIEEYRYHIDGIIDSINERILDIQYEDDDDDE